MKKVFYNLFSNTQQISRVELIALHVLIFHTVGGFTIIEGLLK